MEKERKYYNIKDVNADYVDYFDNGLYITKSGRVFGTDEKGQYEIIPYINKFKGTKNGYYRFTYNNHMYQLHNILGHMYIPGYKKGLVVDHIDNNSLNNDLSNLRWTTRGENVKKFWNSLSDEEMTKYKEKYGNGVKKAHAEEHYKNHLNKLHNKED